MEPAVIHSRTQHGDVVELLKELVRFRSVSHEEGPLADFVDDYLGARRVPRARHGDNLYFWLGSGEDRLLLNSHLDVVPESSDHPYDPFDPVVVEGKLYGRGSVDAKASGAAMTTALIELAAEGWNPPGGRLIVALTTCEEVGRGYNGLEDLRRHLPDIAAALIGEPTNMRPCTAQKGLLMLKAHATGRAAHAARASLGENAIEMAARDIERLAEYRLEKRHPLLGDTLVTVTTISGGTASNVVPDRCTFTLDIRSTPEYTHDELVARITGLLESRIEVYSDRLVPVSTSSEQRIVRACVEATGKNPFGSPTMSDWIFLKDVPAVKIGPGSSELSHTSDEHVDVDDVRRAVTVYKQIIKNYYAPAS